MANAPAPTSAPESIATEEHLGQRQFFSLTFKGETKNFSPMISLQERFVVLNATGGTSVDLLITMWDTAPEEVFSVLWWLARRQNGEPMLPWAMFAAEWPVDASVDDMDFDVVDLDAPAEGQALVEQLEGAATPES